MHPSRIALWALALNHPLFPFVLRFFLSFACCLFLFFFPLLLFSSSFWRSFCFFLGTGWCDGILGNCFMDFWWICWIVFEKTCEICFKNAKSLFFLVVILADFEYFLYSAFQSFDVKTMKYQHLSSFPTWYLNLVL